MVDHMLHAGQDQEERLSPENEALMEFIKEYESNDVPGESLQSAQLAKLVNKIFRTQMADQA